jgi:sugar phosphate isomerase/epimerase
MNVALDNPVAVQLYTERESLRDDFPGTLRRLAEGGVRGVELFGFTGMPFAELPALVQELGLRVPGAHVAYPVWEDDLGPALDAIIALGGEYAVVPWLPPENRGGVEKARTLAANLNRWAEAANAAGLGFAYHNHDFEFDPLPDGDGDTMFDILVKETDPNLVNFEVDVYWAAHGGLDPAHLLRELQGRIPLIHLKDMAAGPERRDLPAGEGILRWDEILSASSAGGTRWLIVEQDNPRQPIEDSLLAVRNVERMLNEG